MVRAHIDIQHAGLGFKVALTSGAPYVSSHKDAICKSNTCLDLNLI